LWFKLVNAHEGIHPRYGTAYYEATAGESQTDENPLSARDVKFSDEISSAILTVVIIIFMRLTLARNNRSRTNIKAMFALGGCMKVNTRP
jgi:hypothetical protein